MSMSAKELHEELMDEPHDERDTEKVQLILRALSLLAAVEDGDEIARELREVELTLDATDMPVHSAAVRAARARITLDAQEKAALDRHISALREALYGVAEDRSALKAELASVKAHAEAMADAIQFGDMAILTVAKAAAEAYRAARPKE